RNPWNLAHTPGGSSGGASSLTAAGICPFNHGNDGGGSIRIPSAHTGLVGLKPSFGRIPQYPADGPFADVISQGVLARSVLDSAMALNVMAGSDPRDWRSLPDDPRDYTIGLDDGVRGWKIGLSLDLGHVKADPEVRELVEKAARRFEELGAHVEDVGPLIEPLQKPLEVLWSGSFGVRLRQIPTQLHGKLDPGFRALAEQGLAVTLADYARAYEAKSKLARDMGLASEVRPSADPGHADPTAAGRNPVQFRRLPALHQGRALYPALQSHRRAGGVDAGRPHQVGPARRAPDRGPGALRSPRAARHARL